MVTFTKSQAMRDDVNVSAEFCRRYRALELLFNPPRHGLSGSAPAALNGTEDTRPSSPVVGLGRTHKFGSCPLRPESDRNTALPRNDEMGQKETSGMNGNDDARNRPRFSSEGAVQTCRSENSSLLA